jgi:hypothetical protein
MLTLTDIATLAERSLKKNSGIVSEYLFFEELELTITRL